MTEAPADRIIAILCAGLALTMYPLALVPFAVAIPGTAVAFLALGLTFKDGYVVLAGFVFAALAIYGVFSWL